MKKTKNILLLCGGGGTEHDVSKISAQYFLGILEKISDVKAHYLCIEKDGSRRNLLGEDCELRKAGEIFNRHTQETISLDYAIPCIHGPPGENGLIQSVFELMGLPYFGASPEGSLNCFNKVSTKIWLDHLKIPNSPYTFLGSKHQDRSEVYAFFDSHQDIFVKASHQGSSVGCYHVTKKEELDKAIDEAFTLSPYVLFEKTLIGRELEVAVFTHQEKLIATLPGEIVCPQKFYTYEEKYSKESGTKTLTIAPDISEEVGQKIQAFARDAFTLLQLKDLARVDFFLTQEGEIFLNEINTFPGHTPISMFPMMLENTGLSYQDFLQTKIREATQNS